MITDEKLKSLSDTIIKHCPSCGSPNVSVRRAKDGWFYVGCEECWQKNQSDEAMLEYAIEVWNRRVQQSKFLVGTQRREENTSRAMNNFRKDR